MDPVRIAPGGIDTIIPKERVSCLPLPGLLPWLYDDGSMYVCPSFLIEVMDADNLDSDRISIAQTQSPVLNQRMRP